MIRRLLTVLVLPAALVLFAGRLVAGVDRWTPLGPDGGAVTALAMAPGSSGRMWAATQSAGVFVSRDGGAGWEPARSGLPSGEPIQLLAAGGRDGRTLYATTRASFFASSDGGRQWTRRALPVALPPAEDASTEALAVSPADAQTVYLSFSRDHFRGGLLKSVDGGRSWRILDLGIGPALVQPSPVDIVIAPSAPETVYLGTYSETGKILRSSDGGAHWAVAGTLPADSAFVRLAVDPRSDRRLYATQDGALTVSEDAGATWSSPVLVDPALLGQYVMAADLAVDPASPQTLYFALNRLASADGTWYGGGLIRWEGQVFRSLDGGASWSGPTITDPIAGLQVDEHAGRVYAAVSRIGVLRSDDQGETWRKSNRGLGAASVCAVTPDPFSSGVLYLSASLCGPGSGLVALSDDPGFFKGMAERRTDQDAGGAWNSINRGVRDSRRVLETYGIVPDPRVPGTLYALTAQGLFKSGNGGRGWRSLQGGLGTILDAVLAVAVDPADPRTVYAAGYKLGYPFCGGFCPLLPVYFAARSLDGGATWTRLTLPIPLGFDSGDPVFSFVIDPRDSRVVYLLSPTGKLLVSRDRGITWTASAVGPASPEGLVSLQRLVIDPAAPQTLYGTVQAPYGNPPRVVKSVDGGRTWELSFHGMPVRAGVHDLVLDPSQPSTLYAATDRGVFVSADGAESWSPLSAGLTSRNVLSIRVDPFDPATLYAATVGDGGLFVLTRSAR